MEQGRLARAVGPDKAYLLAPVNIKRYILKQGLLAVCFSKIIYSYHIKTKVERLG